MGFRYHRNGIVGGESRVGVRTVTRCITIENSHRAPPKSISAENFKGAVHPFASADRIVSHLSTQSGTYHSFHSAVGLPSQSGVSLGCLTRSLVCALPNSSLKRLEIKSIRDRGGATCCKSSIIASLGFIPSHLIVFHLKCLSNTITKKSKVDRGNAK